MAMLEKTSVHMRSLRHSTPITSVTCHLLPARTWIRPVRLTSGDKREASSMRRFQCHADSGKCTSSLLVTRRSTLAALTALLIQPSLRADAEALQTEDMQQQEQGAASASDRVNDVGPAVSDPVSTVLSQSSGAVGLSSDSGSTTSTSRSQVLQYTAGPAVVGAVTFLIKDREVQQSRARLDHKQHLAASLEQKISSAEIEKQRLSSHLSAAQLQVQDLQRGLHVSQQQCQTLQQAKVAVDLEADRMNVTLVSIQLQLTDTKQQLTEAEGSMTTLKAQLQLTDQYKAESEKQLVNARTGIANLRSRLDELETELRKSKVQSSLQAASLSLDLRSRQQQVDAMRGELQSAGARVAAERQQTEQQAEMLMEQLAIAQTVSADTKTALEEAVVDGDAAKKLLQMERDSTALLAKAREAAVEDMKQVLAELREAKFAAEEQQDRVTGLQADLAAAIHQAAVAQQSNTKLQEEALVHSRQQQHLLDELSQSQEESGQLGKQVASEQQRSSMVQQDLAASLRDSKEALHREAEIMAQLEAQDQRLVEVSAQLQQAQADLMASQRRIADFIQELSTSKDKVQSLDKMKTQLTQIVQSQELEAAELAEQVQELEGDRQHLQIVTQDLDLAEDRIDHLQDALHELRMSVKVALTDAESEKQQFEAAAEAKAQADKALYQGEIEQQAQNIERLESALNRQIGELEATQAQLEATQSSLIDLEDHLTTLEEEEEDVDDELAETSTASFPVQPDAQLGSHVSTTESEQRSSSQGAPEPIQKAGEVQTGLEDESSSATAAEHNDAVQATFVSTMDSLFPVSEDSGEASRADLELSLCEDPYELFEKGKAAVHARGKVQSAPQQARLQPPAEGDTASGEEVRASSPASLTTTAFSSEQSGDERRVDTAVAAAQQAAAMRAAESRAQAAMMVEAVEDRAYEAVMEAQAEAAKHAAEADRLRQQLQFVQQESIQG